MRLLFSLIFLHSCHWNFMFWLFLNEKKDITFLCRCSAPNRPCRGLLDQFKFLATNQATDHELWRTWSYGVCVHKFCLNTPSSDESNIGRLVVAWAFQHVWELILITCSGFISSAPEMKRNEFSPVSSRIGPKLRVVSPVDTSRNVVLCSDAMHVSSGPPVSWCGSNFEVISDVYLHCNGISVRVYHSNDS